MILSKEFKRTWAVIDLDAINHNFKLAGENVCCVVKANAYGHGAVVLSKFYEEIGAAYFAVSNIEEAIQLRKAGIKLPILVLGYTPIECASLINKYDLNQTVYDFDYAFRLNQECERHNVVIKAHIKIDTGMGRIGFQFYRGHDELEKALNVCKMSNLSIVGIFTHFSCSDEGLNDFTCTQFDYFKKAISFFEARGIFFSIKHCSNSAAIIDYPSYHLDMVRAGLSLYGINPTNNQNVSLKPALSLWSVVSNVKKIHKGDSISYGRTFIAQHDMTVATIPIGYADGFWRSNQGHCVYINGEFCEIIGRVCMDQIMVKCKKAKIGDVVEIYGEHIPIERVAKYNNTIPYEILCSIGERVPRVFKQNGEVVEIIDKLI